MVGSRKQWMVRNNLVISFSLTIALIVSVASFSVANRLTIAAGGGIGFPTSGNYVQIDLSNYVLPFGAKYSSDGTKSYSWIISQTGDVTYSHGCPRDNGYYNCGAYDFAIDQGIPLYAAFAGYVQRPPKNTVDGFGNYLFVSDQPPSSAEATTFSFYAHMSDDVRVSDGQWVKQGQLIGFVSDSGIGGGAYHLHFGITFRPNSTNNDFWPVDLSTYPGVSLSSSGCDTSGSVYVCGYAQGVPEIVAGPSFSGQQMAVGFDINTMLPAGPLIVGNDDLNSARVPAGYALELYEHTVDQGRGTQTFLPGPGKYPDSRRSIPENTTSSIRVVRGCFVANAPLVVSDEPMALSCEGPPPPPPPPPPSDGIDIESISYPYIVQPGERFRPSVTVRLQNGTLRESSGDMLRCNDPNCDTDELKRFSAYPFVAVVGSVGSGQNYTFTFYEDKPIIAPSQTGTYTSNWRVWRGGAWAGPNIPVTFAVGEPYMTGCSPSANQVALFVDHNYGGQCVIRAIGDHPNPSKMAFPNDAVSSIKVGRNVRMMLCHDDAYGDPCESFTGNDDNLSNNHIGDDRASSMKVEPLSVNCQPEPGQISVFVGFDYSGQCQSLSIDNYPNSFLMTEFPDNSISSIRVGTDVSARLCRDDDFGGICEWFHQNNPDLRRSVVDAGYTSSARVVLKADVPQPACTPGPNEVGLYDYRNYDGACIIKGIGDYLTPSALGMPAHATDSIQVGANVSARLCSELNLVGRCEWIHSDTPDLNSTVIGLHTTSARVVVKGEVPQPSCTPGPNQVGLYDYRNYDGPCVIRDIGDYLTPTAMGIPAHATDSIQVGANVSVHLRSELNLVGRCEWIHSDTPNLDGTVIGLHTTSMRVALNGDVPQPACTPGPNQVGLYDYRNYDGPCVLKEIGDYLTPSALGIPAHATDSIQVGANVSARLCSELNLVGRCEWIHGDTPDLNSTVIGFHTTSARVVLKADVPQPACTPGPNQVGLYDYRNYDGPCVLKEIGDYLTPSALGIPAHATDSIQIGANVSARLCSELNLVGRCEWIHSDTPDLNSTVIGFHTTSARVVLKTDVPPPSCTPGPNQVGLYDHRGFDGVCVVKDIGEYASHSALGNTTWGVDAIQVGANVSARLCSDANFAGRCETYDRDAPDLRNTLIGHDTESVQIQPKLPIAPQIDETNLEISAIEGRNAVLNWSSTADEHLVEVWISPDDVTMVGWQSETSTVISSLMAGAQYSWRVKARNSAGESPWSETAVITVRPEQPGDLRIWTPSCTSVGLLWNDQSLGEDGYRVYRGSELIEELLPGSSMHIDQGLQEETTFTYSIRSFVGNVESTSARADVSTAACPPTDTIAPSTSSTFSTPANPAGWHRTNVTVSLAATDTSDVAAITYRAEGAQTVASTTVDGDAASLVISGQGQTTITYFATDTLGNVEDEQQVVVQLDKTRPTATAPISAFNGKGTVSESAVNVRFTWTGADALSGVSRYQVQRRINGGSWLWVSEAGLPVAQQVVGLNYGRTYQYRMRAFDQAGNVSVWMAGTPLAVQRHEETAGTAAYTGSWASQSRTWTFGGTTKHASAKGAVARFTFTGTSVAWVTATGPSQGKAGVTVDGVYRGTVDAFASTSNGRNVRYVIGGLSDGSHTIVISVRGVKATASSGTRVDVTGFIVLDPQ